MSDVVTPPRVSDRRSLDNWKTGAVMVGLVLSLVLNVAAIAWGAGKVDSSVRALEASAARTDIKLERFVDKIGDHETRITVLEKSKP